jgi:hypothetical protein
MSNISIFAILHKYIFLSFGVISKKLNISFYKTTDVNNKSSCEHILSFIYIYDALTSTDTS